jgi:hypothetical protein
MIDMAQATRGSSIAARRAHVGGSGRPDRPLGGTVRGVSAEDAVETVDNADERARREIGRPSTAEAYRDVLVQALREDATLRSVELLHRARQAGYAGGKSARYALAQTLRVRTVTALVRFEGLAGEFSQHDFGEVLAYQDGRERTVHFFASRLKYSRWVEVTLVADQRVETLVESDRCRGGPRSGAGRRSLLAVPSARERPCREI